VSESLSILLEGRWRWLRGASIEAVRDAPSLEGVDAKIARAKHHLNDLQNALRVALDPSRIRFAFDSEQENGQHVLRVYGVPEVDPAWRLIIGDCLHNLRSALDHLAWQLVLLDGGEPGDRTQFPIHGSPFNKSGEPRPPQLEPAVRREDILAALKGAQPYSVEKEGRDPADSYLPALQCLNNIDKHRLLLVVACFFHAERMWWSSMEGDPQPAIKVHLRPLDDGDAVAWFDFKGAEPPQDFDPHPTLQVAFHEETMPGFLSRMSVANALHGLIWTVEWEVTNMWFRGFFPEPLSS